MTASPGRSSPLGATVGAIVVLASRFATALPARSPSTWPGSCQRASSSPFPWRSTEKIRYQVIREVVPMDGPAGGNATVDARRHVLDRSGREVAGRVFRLSEPASLGPGTTMAAMSRALGTLSRDIAREPRATER
jgi:uncharacterized lipoprotein YmbA